MGSARGTNTSTGMVAASPITAWSDCPASPCSEASAAQIFAKALDQHPISAEERERYQSFLMLFFAHLDAEKGWTKQLHLGARRNVNTSALRALGPDTGFDTIGDYPQGAALSAYLDVLEMRKRVAADGAVQLESC